MLLNAKDNDDFAIRRRKTRLIAMRISRKPSLCERK